jgi:hypothetical protein
MTEKTTCVDVMAPTCNVPIVMRRPCDHADFWKLVIGLSAVCAAPPDAKSTLGNAGYLQAADKMVADVEG